MKKDLFFQLWAPVNESLSEQELILTWSHFPAHLFPHAAESSLNSFPLQPGNGNYLKSLCCGQGLPRILLLWARQRCPWMLLQAELLLTDQNKNHIPAALNCPQEAGLDATKPAEPSLGTHWNACAKWQGSAAYVTQVSSNSCHRFMQGLTAGCHRCERSDFYIHTLLPEGAL